jgi:hypothetical protein
MTSRLHPAAPHLAHDCGGNKKRDISEIKVRQQSHKDYKGNRDMDKEKPFAGIPFLSLSKKAEGKVDDNRHPKEDCREKKL